MTTHADHRFSVSIFTSDQAILYCLRALADYSQKSGNTRIVWGGTKRTDWEQNNRTVTFHFSDPSYRDILLATANRVLPAGSWKQVSTSDNNPAKPQG